MKLLLLIAFHILITAHAFAQQGDKAEIKKVVHSLFSAMNKRDTASLRSVFSKDAVIQGIGHGSAKLTTFSMDEFLKAITSPHTQTWDLAITDNNITIGDNLSGVKVPYKLNWRKGLNNYGAAFIQLIKQKSDWKIIYLVDSGANSNHPIKN